MSNPSKCSVCHHEEEVHGGGGCLVMEFKDKGPDSVPLERCFCIHVKGAMPIYVDVPTPALEFNESEGYFDPNGYWHRY